MNLTMITRLPNLLFGAPGTTAHLQEWSSQTAIADSLADDHDLRPRTVAIVDDDPQFLKKLGRRRGSAAMSSFKSATPLLHQARHAASLSGTPPWKAMVIAVGLADLNGITAMARIKTLFPQLPVWLALPMEEPHSMIAAICAGADGYLLKHQEADSLRATVADLATAEPPISGRLATHLYGLLTQTRSATAPIQAHYGFSTEQLRFIRLTAERGSTVDAARAMGVDVARRRELVLSIYRQLRNRITSAAILSDMRLTHLAIH